MQSLVINTCTALCPLLLPLILPCILLALALKLWNVYNENTRDVNCPAPLPEGSMGWPFIGETVQFLMQGSNFFRKKFLKYGPIFKTHIIGRPTIRVIGVEYVREILLRDGEIVEPFYPQSIRTTLGSPSRSLLFSTGEEHDRLRRQIMKVFHHNHLSAYVPFIQKYAREAVTKWCLEEVVCGERQPRELLFRIAGKVLCGFDHDEAETKYLAEVYQNMADVIFAVPIDLPGSGFNKAMKGRRILLNRIEAKIKQWKNQEKSENDFDHALSILSKETDENGEAWMDVEQLKGFALELIFSGHTSSATATTMMLLYLAQHPEVVAKARLELQEHGLLDSPEPITMGAICNLRYITCVVKEVLRIAPPIGAGFRKVTKTFELMGKQFPVGWTVLFSIRETQDLAPNYTDPYKFDPDRFMPERQEDKKGDRFSYIPFAMGPRSCLGKQFAMLTLKIELIELVKSSRWEVVSPANPTVTFIPVPHVAEGLMLRFTRLDCNSKNVAENTDGESSVAQ